MNGTVLRARYDDFTESVGGAAVSRAGNVPTSVPQQAANAWLSWNFMPQWTFAAGLRYVGGRYADTANKVRVPSYTTVDTALSRRVSKQAALTLRVYNLFNRDYAESVSNGGQQWLLADPVPRSCRRTYTSGRHCRADACRPTILHSSKKTIPCKLQRSQRPSLLLSAAARPPCCAIFSTTPMGVA